MMTQSQVASYMAEKIGITKKQAKTMLEELNALVVKELKKEGSLRLAGLGIFRKRKTKARMGRNPATGQEIKIPARTRLRFTAAKALKDKGVKADALEIKQSNHYNILFDLFKFRINILFLFLRSSLTTPFYLILLGRLLCSPLRCIINLLFGLDYPLTSSIPF